MAQVVIRNIDDDVMERLRARARRKGIALERELRDVLTAAVRSDRASFRARAERFRQQLARRRHSDSTVLLRRDRRR
jgi:plasmid stability protein